MVDFINEVEEELRKDKYNALLRKYGAFIVAIIVGIVAYAGYVEYRKYDDGKKARAASTSFVAAEALAKSGDLQAAITNFETLAELAPKGYSGLSYSRAAALKVQVGDMDGAVKAFDKAANSFSQQIHKDLASVKAMYILLDLRRNDDVIARANTLRVNDSPYSDLARELSSYAQLGKGDTGAARTGFLYLSTAPGVLGGVKSRASQALALINANKTVDEPDVTVLGEIDNADTPQPDNSGAQSGAQEEDMP